MKRMLAIVAVIFVLAPALANADPWKDKGGKGKHDAKEYLKRQEKAVKEYRKGQEEYWKEREKDHKEAGKREREHERHDSLYQEGYFPSAPRPVYPEPRYDDRYDHRDGSFHDGYYHDGGQTWHDSYGTYYPRPREERPLGVYTPFGHYQEAPRSQPGYGPRLEGQGQIGPYRFEVWR